MPRSYDSNAIAAARGGGSSSDYSPTKNQLNFAGESIDEVATMAANEIMNGIKGAVGQVFGLIQSLTGIDLTPIEELLTGTLGTTTVDSSTGLISSGVDISSFTSTFTPLNLLSSLISSISDAIGAGDLTSVLPKIVGALSGIDLSSPGGIIAAIESAVADVIPDFSPLATAITGLTDFTSFSPTDAIAVFFTGWADGSGNSALTDLENAITGASKTGTGGALSNIRSFFGGFGSGSSLLSQLVTAMGGGGGALSDVEAVFAGLPSLSVIAEDITGLTDFSSFSPSDAIALFFGNLGSFLPFNLNSGSFDPIAAGEQMLSAVLTPAGALTSLTQIPTHILGSIAPGGNSNVLPPFAAGNVDGEGLWSWDAATSSWMTTCDGTLREMLSVPFQVTSGAVLTGGVDTAWSGVTGTGGPSIQVACNVYGPTQDVFLSTVTADPTNDGSTVSSPGAASSGFQTLSATFTMPTGAVFARLALLVDPAVQAGTVKFRSPVLQMPQRIDSSLLGNLTNHPQLAAALIGGIQNVPDIGSTIQNTWNNWVTALGAELTGDASLHDVSTALQTSTTNTAQALSLSQAASNTLGIINNKAINSGLEATVESNLDLSSLGSGTAPTLISVTQAASAGGFVRCGQAVTKGFCQWWGYKSGTITHFYLNFYKMDSSGNNVLLFSSADLAAGLPTTGQWNVYAFPGVDDIAVNPGEQLSVEYQLIGSGTVFVAGVGQSWQTNHPTAATKRSAFSQNWGTGAAATIAAASIGYTGNTPYVGLGVSNLPPNYEPPETHVFNTAGAYTDTAPSWWRPGTDIVDVIVLGGGGEGGAGAFGAGQPGTASTATVGATTVTGAAGAGGVTGTTGSGSPTNGQSPGNYLYNGVTYYGGTTVGPQAIGSPPGGGGGSGKYGAIYGHGAQAGTWAAQTFTAPGVSTVTGTVGSPGVWNGSQQTPGGNGAAGEVWVVWRQA